MSSIFFCEYAEKEFKLKSVDVLLATYNGEKYVQQQIFSILNQDYHGRVRLLIRDDGSTDDTLAVISKIEDERVVLIRDHLGGLGPANNFKELMKRVKADYILFSDQDDVWMSDKISKLVSYAEEKFTDAPSLLYCNSHVVDENLNKIGMTTYSSPMRCISIDSLFFLNGGVQGCAMLFNRKLNDVSLSYDGYWFMHDQVVSFVAACFGSVYCLDEKLQLYRQHGNNVLGFSSRSLLQKIVIDRSRSYLLDSRSVRFILSFYQHFKEDLLENNIMYFEQFRRFIGSSTLGGVFIIYKTNFKLNNSRARLIVKNLIYTKKFNCDNVVIV